MQSSGMLSKSKSQVAEHSGIDQASTIQEAFYKYREEYFAWPCTDNNKAKYLPKCKCLEQQAKVSPCDSDD